MKKVFCLFLICVTCICLFSGCSHNHIWEDATCEHPRTCNMCGETQGDALAHHWIGECGQKEYCADCGKISNVAIEHDYTIADCTQNKHCKKCGRIDAPALGHDLIDVTILQEANCGNEGKQEGICSLCGENITTVIPATNEHTIKKWTISKEATCTVTGLREGYCSICQQDISEKIDFADCIVDDSWVLDGTISSDGIATCSKKCKVCGSVAESERFQLTMGQINAYKSAQSYLRHMSFSRSGLIDQLEFEGYTTEDAITAVELSGVNWFEQAAKKAESYLRHMSFSRSGLIDQLKFEGFTKEEAEYGVSAVGY